MMYNTAMDNTFGEQVMVLRKRAGLSQPELALKAGLSRNEISMIEGDRVNCTLATMNAVADALGVNLIIRLGENPK